MTFGLNDEMDLNLMQDTIGAVMVQLFSNYFLSVEGIANIIN
jgi:hypothetical protein